MPNKLSFDEVKRRIKYLNSNMEILNETEPKGNKEDPFICHCRNCNAIFDTTGSSIKRTYTGMISGRINKHIWCPICSNKRCVTGINDIATTRPDLVQYFANKEEAQQYTKYSSEKIIFRCPTCGYEKKMGISLLSSNGFYCDECSDTISYPNKVCRAFVKQLPVDDYILEYSSKWTQRKRYDAYFLYKNIKYLLEFDGVQHYCNTQWGSKKFQNDNDDLKSRLAKQHGYKLIRINCFDSDFIYIKNNILNSELAELFDLSNIDWKLCEQETLQNITLEIANYYNEHPDVSASAMSKVFHLGKTTIYRYLRKANRIGLCIYPREKKSKIKKDLSRISSDRRPFNVYTSDRTFIGQFKSVPKCHEYLKSIDLDINQYTINYYLITGQSINGYSFEYVGGLADHYKHNPIMQNICEYYNEHPMVNALEISKIFNISKSTVSKYLIAGCNIGWCNYG